MVLGSSVAVGRLVATAPIGPLAWEPPHKDQKKKKKKGSNTLSGRIRGWSVMGVGK